MKAEICEPMQGIDREMLADKDFNGDVKDDVRVLKAMANQVGGQKIMFVESSGCVCKLDNGNELKFYRMCEEYEWMEPFKQVTPQVLKTFKMRPGVDKLDLVY